MSKPLNIVVVGGGPTGAAVAKELSAKLDASKHSIILITARDFYTHLPATIRTVVTSKGNLEERVLIPYDKLFANGKGKLIVGTVSSIQDNGSDGGKVILANGETVDYSILVLATGSIWEGPLNLPTKTSEAVDYIRRNRQDFEAANHIVLVGGGAVGIEHAGEIKETWPDKNVTIVHSQKHLLNDTYPQSWREDVQRRIELRGVDVILSDYIDSLELKEGGKLTTRGGKVLKADLIVPTRGGRPNTAFIKSLGDDVLTDIGFVKVSPTLQLLKHPRIFAGGDIIEWKEQKQAVKSGNHAAIIAKNILSLVKGGNQVLAAYKGSAEIIIVTIGSTGGASFFNILWGLKFGDKISSLLKSKTLFVEPTRKSLGHTD
ncbi:FAD/NAD(P)-binding domain-containing protein [Crucibulum laeve]|uniref:FAD/NAD(P)-binding domain-containing protein n=1 Tax=Crucibulum laeve TaxID=68775 RepID=A0A5C3LKD1_9AGAR|nr:FAD/NAD(P)-binding domain-containing protein [Crucibulum laeve]